MKLHYKNNVVKFRLIQTQIQTNATMLCHFWGYLTLFGPQCYGECPLVGTPCRGDPANPPPGGCTVGNGRTKSPQKYVQIQKFEWFFTIRAASAQVRSFFLFCLSFISSSLRGWRLGCMSGLCLSDLESLQSDSSLWVRKPWAGFVSSQASTGRW